MSAQTNQVKLLLTAAYSR